jgi:Luciferase-like monooxygenase
VRVGGARLGTMVTGVCYRHPAVLANMVAALDVTSNGRLELGKTRLCGLKLQATDADIVVGWGERVEGPAVTLLLAAGRRAALPGPI